MGYRRSTHKAGYFYKREYQYDPERDTYTCPQDEPLTYTTTSHEGIATINRTRRFVSIAQLERAAPVTNNT